MEDNWMEEEARSQVWNEKAQKIYELYIWNALASLNNTKVQRLHRDEDGECVESEEPNELFMRIVEKAIDISEKQARDFRASVTSKHCSRLKTCVYSYNAPRWHEDGAMYQAIAEVLRMMDWEKIPTIITINAKDVCDAACQKMTYDKVSELAAASPHYHKFNFISKESVMAYEEIHIKYTCTCSMDTLMREGCNCGHLKKHENSR